MTAAQRRLVLVRHADAARPPATADADRDLTPLGETEAAAVGALLNQAGLVPDLVVTSPSLRTRRTWSLAAAAGRFSVPVSDDPSLYHASADELIEVVTACDDALGVVVLCGHNPGLSELAVSIAGDCSDPATAAHIGRGLRTGDVASFRVPGPWRSVGPALLTLEWVRPAR